MTARFLHVSDLHFGAGRDAEIEVGLSRLLENLDLELIVASGDLTSPGLAPGVSAGVSKQGDPLDAAWQAGFRPVVALAGPGRTTPWKPGGNASPANTGASRAPQAL